MVLVECRILSSFPLLPFFLYILTFLHQPTHIIQSIPPINSLGYPLVHLRADNQRLLQLLVVPQLLPHQRCHIRHQRRRPLPGRLPPFPPPPAVLRDVSEPRTKGDAEGRGQQRRTRVLLASPLLVLLLPLVEKSAVQVIRDAAGPLKAAAAAATTAIAEAGSFGRR